MWIYLFAAIGIMTVISMVIMVAVNFIVSLLDTDDNWEWWDLDEEDEDDNYYS